MYNGCTHIHIMKENSRKKDSCVWSRNTIYSSYGGLLQIYKNTHNYTVNPLGPVNWSIIRQDCT